MKQITIFTPTFNRAYILPRLYNSLKMQTSGNFLWLIVDDGSSDDTEELVNTWLKEGLVEIQYAKQKNQGKSIAHNSGVELTATELFTCVDSDDFLVANAVESVLEYWREKSDKNVVGMLAFKQYSDGRTLTTMTSVCIKSTLYDAYAKHKLHGDTMLIFRSEIIKKYNFPSFPGEKFVPEAYLYDLIDQEGQLIILKEALYCCEYLEDGYSQNMAKLLKQNPKGYIAYIKQRLKFDKGIKQKVLDTIRYISICIASHQRAYISNSVFPIITILMWPIGYLFYLVRYSKD